MFRSASRKFLIVIAAAVLAACTQNPATGKNQFTFMTPEQERAVGAQQHAQVVAQFGGEAKDAALRAYVKRIGDELVANSELAGQEFHFTLLDSPVVNAFALPGGYVYITRGILALANDEAELASVLGHEIAHVTARHGAQRHTRSTWVGLLSAGLSAAFGSQWVDTATQVAGAYAVSSYSREQEYEADALGIRYIDRTGYDPYGSPRFLYNLGSHTSLEKRMAGQADVPSINDFFATHPSAPDRVKRASALAANANEGARGKPSKGHLAAIDGMIYGDSEEQGFVRGSQFLHPVLRFGFTVPESYKMQNTPGAVIAQGPPNRKMQFDAGAVDPSVNTQTYLTQVWAKDQNLRDLKKATIAGQETYTALLDGNGGIYRLVVMRAKKDQVWRFIMAAPTDDFAAADKEFVRIAYSFRALSASEAASLKPLRLRTYRVRSGDTVSGIARKMAVEDYHEARFRVLNGLAANEQLQTGQMVKFISEN